MDEGRGAKLAWLKAEIARRVFVRGTTARITSQMGEPQDWLFDFRRLTLDGEALARIADLFLDETEELGTVQWGGIETASLPLITACVMRAKERGRTARGFYIRKSRKKSGLRNNVEGEVSDDPIILVDDLMNSGLSFMQQVRLLEEHGKRVVAVCVILRYRDLEAYEELSRRGIRIISLFTLDAFDPSLSSTLASQLPPALPPQPFEVLWRFRPPHFEGLYVIPHSAPVLDEGRLYFGADDGTFWCLDQETGTIVWSFKVPFGTQGKFTFSTPAIFEDLVIFGAYDGNLYALNKTTGVRVWTYFDADWIGSSPAIAHDLGFVMIGLEFGLPGRQGGVAALDATTGTVMWCVRDIPDFVHASPAYSPRCGLVVCGANDGVMRAYDAKTGKLRWSFKTGGDIKYGAAFTADETLVAFGSFDGCVYVLETASGRLRHRFDTMASIFSTPLFDGDLLYAASLDKHLYCFDVRSGETRFARNTYARIYATPVIYGNALYIGANNGRLFRLSKETGAITGIFQATERIVNKIAYNPAIGRLFVPTFANEIYCLTEPQK